MVPAWLIAFLAVAFVAGGVFGYVLRGRFDLAAWIIGELADAQQATWVIGGRHCPGCGRTVHMVRWNEPIGYRCLTCSGRGPVEQA